MSSLQPIIGTNENQGPTAIAADLTTRLIACTAVGLRFWARWIGGTRYWWDDWLILAAAVYVVLGTIMEMIWTIRPGLGRHIGWLLEHQPETMPTFAKILYADEQLYAPEVTLINLGPDVLEIMRKKCRETLAICDEWEQAITGTNFT